MELNGVISSLTYLYVFNHLLNYNHLCYLWCFTIINSAAGNILLCVLVVSTGVSVTTFLGVTVLKKLYILGFNRPIPDYSPEEVISDVSNV